MIMNIQQQDQKQILRLVLFSLQGTTIHEHIPFKNKGLLTPVFLHISSPSFLTGKQGNACEESKSDSETPLSQRVSWSKIGGWKIPVFFLLDKKVDVQIC